MAAPFRRPSFLSAALSLGRACFRTSCGRAVPHWLHRVAAWPGSTRGRQETWRLSRAGTLLRPAAPRSRRVPRHRAQRSPPGRRSCPPSCTACVRPYGQNRRSGSRPNGPRGMHDGTGAACLPGLAPTSVAPASVSVDWRGGGAWIPVRRHRRHGNRRHLGGNGVKHMRSFCCDMV